MGATGRVRHTHGGAATNTHHRTALKRAQVCTRWASAVFGLRHDDLDDTHGHDRLDVTSTSAQYMPAQTWSGARDGYVFTCGALGLGYYLEGCTGLADNAWDSALGERGVDEEVIAKLDQALLSSEVVIGVVKQSVAVLEQQRHQLRRPSSSSPISKTRWSFLEIFCSLKYLIGTCTTYARLTSFCFG